MIKNLLMVYLKNIKDELGIRRYDSIVQINDIFYDFIFNVVFINNRIFWYLKLYLKIVIFS